MRHPVSVVLARILEVSKYLILEYIVFTCSEALEKEQKIWGAYMEVFILLLFLCSWHTISGRVMYKKEVSSNL